MRKVKISHKETGLKKEYPYFDQLSNPDKKRIKSEYGLIKDVQAARRFGARSIEEYSYWSWRSCALACVAMVLKAEKKFDGKLFNLVQEALLKNGYAFRNHHGMVDIGWRHDCLVEMLENRGLRAEAQKENEVGKILENIYLHRHVIASVKSKRGGHMVLIKGAFQKDGVNGFEVNDPDQYSGGGESIYWNFDKFCSKYLGKLIYIWKE